MSRSPSGLRRLIPTLLVALALSSAVVISPLSVHPARAAGCLGSGCNAQDPQAMGCYADGQDVSEFTYRDVRVILRYSASCSAQWARFYNPLGGAPGYRWVELGVWSAQSGGSLKVTLNTFLEDDTTVSYGGWTAMWSYYGGWAAACMSNNSAIPDGPCTARH